MALKVDFLLHWPNRETVRKTLPEAVRRKFPRLTSIIDCFEIFVERHRNQKAKNHSDLKKSCIMKVSIACTPSRSISFISSAPGSSGSDTEIVHESDLVNPEYHLLEDQVLVNTALSQQDTFTFICCAEPIAEKPKKRRGRMAAKDRKIPQNIRSVKNHVEGMTG